MKRTYRHEFEVTGTSAFPLDMLRYDSCFPLTTADAQTIHHSLVPDVVYSGKGRKWVVKLEKTTTGKEPQITHGRWQSFGWQYVPDSHHAIKL